MVMVGGIGKEIANTGNGHRIETELVPKVPAMLHTGGFFPMFDHALQTDVGFEELCRAVTRLQEICGSTELGQFPRRSRP